LPQLYLPFRVLFQSFLYETSDSRSGNGDASTRSPQAPAQRKKSPAQSHLRLRSPPHHPPLQDHPRPRPHLLPPLRLRLRNCPGETPSRRRRRWRSPWKSRRGLAFRIQRPRLTHKRQTKSPYPQGLFSFNRDGTLAI